MRIQITLISAAAALGLTACSNAPAGSGIDTGGFGDATMNNTQVMNGDLAALVNLSQRFAAEAPTTVNFAFNSATLDATAQEALRKQAAWIRQYPEVRFAVYGHTDKVGSNAYNKALGLRRARTALNYLVSHGVERGRLKALVSYGETQPLIVTEGKERRNRRTVTEVSGFLKPREQFMDGKYALFTYDEYVRSASEAQVATPYADDAAKEER